jgi:hypothetical protein
MEKNHEDRWVADRLATLEPQWRPNLAHGRELLNDGLRARTHVRSWPAIAAAAAALCIAAVVFPGTRALAQQFWYRFVLNRVDVVRVDLSKLPLHMQVTTNGLEQTAQDTDQAERLAGFRPNLPADAVAGANPQITVSGPIAVEQTIHVSQIESALRRVGAGNVLVPADWEGVQLHAQIGPIVAANYPGNVQVLQARPIELFVPAGFSLASFIEVAFRTVGLTAWEVQTLARKYAANPAWMLDIPADGVVDIQEVMLPTGPALLIQDFDDHGRVARATVIRSALDRIYAVSTTDREVSIRIANALP